MGWLKFSQFWRLRRRSSHEWSWHSLVSVGSHFESDLLQTWLLMILFKAVSSFSVPCLYFVNLICMICIICYIIVHLLLAVLEWEFQEGKGSATFTISHSSWEPTWHDIIVHYLLHGLIRENGQDSLLSQLTWMIFNWGETDSINKHYNRSLSKSHFLR